jgi:phage terminase large subunit-like protein
VCCKVNVFTRAIDGAKHYFVFAKHYLPERTIDETHVNKNAYTKWVNEGRIIATPGAEIDFDIVKEDVIEDSRRHMVNEIVYDPWRATQLAHQLMKEGATVIEMTQNVRNMGEAFDELTSAIKAKRLHHDGDPVLEWMASNVVAKTVTKGLVIPAKDSADAKIDGIVALVMALARAMLTPASEGVMGWFKSAVTA